MKIKKFNELKKWASKPVLKKIPILTEQRLIFCPDSFTVNYKDFGEVINFINNPNNMNDWINDWNVGIGTQKNITYEIYKNI
jgi:hypothetical protein